MTEFEKKGADFLQEVSSLMKKNEAFAFWETLAQAEKLLEKMPSKKIGKVEKNVVVQGRVFVCKGVVIKAGTRIEGNVFAGENAVIGPNAFLRGSVVLGKNCRIGQSEVKNSVFLDNSNAPHFNYVGDSIIGESVNLGAGTKIANLRHDNQSVKVKINGKEVDSGKRKLGALVGSGTKTGVNSSINCGAIVPQNTKIFPNEFYR